MKWAWRRVLDPPYTPFKVCPLISDHLKPHWWWYGCSLAAVPESCSVFFFNHPSFFMRTVPERTRHGCYRGILTPSGNKQSGVLRTCFWKPSNEDEASSHFHFQWDPRVLQRLNRFQKLRSSQSGHILLESEQESIPDQGRLMTHLLFLHEWTQWNCHSVSCLWRIFSLYSLIQIVNILWWTSQQGYWF